MSAMDVMKPDQRRRAMASNHGRTQPELALARDLWKRGFRYLTHKGYKARLGRSLVGHPDMIFSRMKLVVFIDGCFWHGCPECGGVREGMNDFWRGKIEKNIARDKKVSASLEAAGWVVVRVPEHSIRTKTLMEQTSSKLEVALREHFAKLGR